MQTNNRTRFTYARVSQFSVVKPSGKYSDRIIFTPTMLLTNLRIESNRISQPTTLSHSWILITDELLKYNFYIDDIISFTSSISSITNNGKKDISNHIPKLTNIKILSKGKDEKLSFNSFLKDAMWNKKFLLSDKFMKHYYIVNKEKNIEDMLNNSIIFDLKDLDKRIKEIERRFSSIEEE